MMDAQVKLLKQYMIERNLMRPEKQSYPLFQNNRGEKLTRAGVSYILDKYVKMARNSNPDLVPDEYHAIVCDILKQYIYCNLV